MKRRFKKRRVRKRRSLKGNSKMKFLVVIGIMIIAVLLGYLTARFVIGPILGYNADESLITSGIQSSSEKTDTEGQKDEDIAVPKKGYALQFGVYSTKEAANQMVSSLKEKGIESKIIMEDDLYKVISPIIKTKDKALDQLEDIKDKEIEDVFIASF